MFFAFYARSTSSTMLHAGTPRQTCGTRPSARGAAGFARLGRFFWLTLLPALVLPALHAGELENQLNARWRGAWVIIKSESYSGCNGAYTNNQVHGDLVNSKGSWRFEPGELGRIHKIDLKRSRIDVLIDLNAHLLVPYQDGPFELYRDVACQLELMIQIPRELVKAKDSAGIERMLSDSLERYGNQRAAADSPAWNGRRRDDYPPDYQQTLSEYEAWKVERHNQAIAERIQASLAESRRILSQVKSDRGFALGFAAGITSMRQAYFGDCNSLLSGNFSGYRKQASNDQSQDWKYGFEEGQKLVYYMVLAERLPACFL